MGEDSRIPNIGGIRKALVDALQGNQAGRGPLARRVFRRFVRLARRRRAARTSVPRRTNFWADDPPSEAAGQRARRSTTPTPSAPTSSCGSAGWSARSRTWRRTCAPCRPARSSSGSSTATPPPAAPPWPTARRGRRPRPVRGPVLGRGQRVLGLRRELHARGVRRASSAGSPPGRCRITAWTSRSSARGRTAATWTGPAASSGSWPSGATWAAYGGWALHHYCSAPERRGRGVRRPRVVRPAGAVPTGWSRSSPRTGR